jgi:hypothetical protein
MYTLYLAKSDSGFAVHCSSTVPSPAVAVKPIGAEGAVTSAGVADTEADKAEALPSSSIARIEKD